MSINTSHAEAAQVVASWSDDTMVFSINPVTHLVVAGGFFIENNFINQPCVKQTALIDDHALPRAAGAAAAGAAPLTNLEEMLAQALMTGSTPW